VATAVIVAVALVVGHHSSLGYLLLPVVAIAFLVTSTYPGRQRQSSSRLSNPTWAEPGGKERACSQRKRGRPFLP
jgi:hypothetical protein